MILDYDTGARVRLRRPTWRVVGGVLVALSVVTWGLVLYFAPEGSLEPAVVLSPNAPTTRQLERAWVPRERKLDQETLQAYTGILGGDYGATSFEALKEEFHEKERDRGE